MEYSYNKDEIKNNLNEEQMIDILNDLGAEPVMKDDNTIICRTVCHCGNSHKLYGYLNTKLFRCYTDCGGAAFDLFELVRKVKAREEDNKDYSLPKAIFYVANFFGIAPEEHYEAHEKLEDWKILDRYDKTNNITIDPKDQEIRNFYDGSFLKNLPQPRILPWENDGITKTAIKEFEIKFEPSHQSVVIPHYDVNGNLIGIRQRILSDDMAKKYGKYIPLRIGKKTYNHSLSFNLYGLYQNQENIVNTKRAIIFEGEKSVLQFESIFGRELNISVAVCGSSISDFQINLLMNLGVREITIAFDRQFKELGDKEHRNWVSKLKDFHRKYGQFVTISYIFDKEMITDYKDSPIDKGRDIFMKLYKDRVCLY